MNRSKELYYEIHATTFCGNLLNMNGLKSMLMRVGQAYLNT